MLAYKEETHIGLWSTGKRIHGSWAHPDEESSFYELKSYVDNIIRRVGIAQNSIIISQSDNDVFSTGLTYSDRNGKVFVEIGIINKKLQKKFDIGSTVYYADIHWNTVVKTVRKKTISFHEISKYPIVSRDLALLIDKNIKFSEIEKTARSAEKKFLKNVELFDVYEGKNLPEGKKSYAVNFILQDEEKTLADKQIDAIMTKIINALKNNLKAELR